MNSLKRKVEMYNNPLIIKFPSAKSKEEDYVTEAFASLLRFLLLNEYQLASDFLRLLTQNKLDLTNHQPNEVTIRTQKNFSFVGRPDIEITIPDYVIYIENKIEASLGENQIERYKSIIQRSDRRRVLLVLVSKYRTRFQKKPDFHLRWFQIARWLEDRLNDLESDDVQNAVFQFLEFLRYRYLAQEAANRQVSKSLKKYIQREGKENLLMRNMSRTRDIGDDQDLIPLRKLLNVMAFSIEKAYPTKSFGFSNNILGLKGEFSGIGFNIAFRYDFFIDINQPNTLFFKTPCMQIANTKWGIEKIGKLVKISSGIYWVASLKLSARDILFFTMSFDEQLSLLCNFLVESRTALEKICSSNSFSTPGQSSL